MSLTGIPLILLAACATAGALAVTVLVWPRWGRRRYLLRPAGVLLTEVLLTATVGLAVNRSQQFYPSWAALLASSDPGNASYHVAAGRLDGRLAGGAAPQTFPWRPVGWTRWHLAAPPSVTVPTGYLQHPGWRYSAVLVIANAADAGPAPTMAGPTLLVSIRTTNHTTAGTLAVTVPGELGRDLRVTGHRWALVTSARDDTLAREVVTAARGRYPAVAFVGAAPARKTNRPARAVKPAKPAKTAKTAKPVKPRPLPIGVDASYFPTMAAALTWAAAQTPLPLAASAPEPTYLPLAPRRSPGPHPSAARTGRHVPPRIAPTPSGGPDGSGQPRP